MAPKLPSVEEVANAKDVEQRVLSMQATPWRTEARCLNPASGA